MKSCIRYFGGKGNGLSKRLLSYFPDNYEDMEYLEAFGGSAAVLFSKKISPIEIYNDTEENVYSLFKVLSDNDLFKVFKEKCDLTPYSKRVMEDYKLSLKTDELDIGERAYKYFIVNRTAYNGHGGFSSSPAIRRNMSKSISDYLSTVDRLYEIHQRLSKVIIHNTDAISLIEKYDKDGWMMYLDPPYHWSTRTTSRYKEDMSDEKQQEFLETLIGCDNSKILVSGYDCKDYDVLEENGWNKVSFEVKTQNTNREGKTKVETIWFNY